MSTSRSRKPRASRTRSDVAESFKEIQSEGTEALDSQAASLAAEHAKTVRKAVSILSIDEIAQKNAALSLEVNRTYADVTEKCIGKATELKTLTEAVALESKELERLYGLDIASASIKILIEEHEEKKEALLKEITEFRAQWTEEQNDHTKKVRQRDADLSDMRRRDNEAYEYNKQQTRAKDDDAFAQAKLLRERELNERVNMTEKDLTFRQGEIAKQEKEITELRARVAGIDAEITKAENRAVAIATSALKKDLEHTFALKEKDLEANLARATQDSNAKDAANARLAEQVISLQKQLDAARDQNRDISIKAFESVSGQLALSKVQESLRENGSGARGGKA
jgi:uncharacterized small protein (DUF1192 family)